MIVTSGEGEAPKLGRLVVWNTYWTRSENFDAVVAFRTRSMTSNTRWASGDIQANTSVMSAAGSAEAAGPSTWSADREDWERNSSMTMTRARNRNVCIINISFASCMDLSPFPSSLAIQPNMVAGWRATIEKTLTDPEGLCTVHPLSRRLACKQHVIVRLAYQGSCRRGT